MWTSLSLKFSNSSHITLNLVKYSVMETRLDLKKMSPFGGQKYTRGQLERTWFWDHSNFFGGFVHPNDTLTNRDGNNVKAKKPPYYHTDSMLKKWNRFSLVEKRCHPHTQLYSWHSTKWAWICSTNGSY